MTIKSLLFTLILFLGITTQITAQKFGHLNSGNVISQMPEMKAAEKELETFQKQINDATDVLQKALDGKASVLAQEYQDLAPVTAQERYQALEKEQQDILKRRQDDQAKVLKKRDDLMKPILDKIQTAIDEVGKENGYTFIFDTSMFNAILFVEDSDDVAPLVKAKLGM